MQVVTTERRSVSLQGQGVYSYDMLIYGQNRLCHHLLRYVQFTHSNDL